MGGLWKQHPQTKVLSCDTGFRLDYGRYPYGDYDQNGDICFPLSFRSSQYYPKECVIGIEINGNFKSYPFVELFQQKSPLEDVLGEVNKLFWNLTLKHETVFFTMPKGKSCRA